MVEQAKSETQAVEVTAGPYAGKLLTMSAADAKQAIADKWARDPHETPDPDKPKPELTDEQRAEVLKKAEAAAAKLRGEDKHEGEHRDQRPAAPSRGYQTRNSKADD